MLKCIKRMAAAALLYGVGGFALATTTFYVLVALGQDERFASGAASAIAVLGSLAAGQGIAGAVVTWLEGE